MLVWLIAISFVAPFVHMGAAFQLKADPLGGAHAGLMCPLICDGCKGPYVYNFVSSKSRARASTPLERDAMGKTNIYCQAPGTKVVGWSAMELFKAATKLRAQRVWGGGFFLYATLLPLWIVGFTVLGLALAVSRRRSG